MNAPPYSIGSSRLNGISKLIEEMGELHTVLGKAMAVGCFGKHWSCDDLCRWAEEEMGDVIAAIDFVANENGISRAAIAERARTKLAIFEQWNVERGPSKKETPPFGAPNGEHWEVIE